MAADPDDYAYCCNCCVKHKQGPILAEVVSVIALIVSVIALLS